MTKRNTLSAPPDNAIRYFSSILRSEVIILCCTPFFINFYLTQNFPSTPKHNYKLLHIQHQSFQVLALRMIYIDRMISRLVQLM